MGGRGREDQAFIIVAEGREGVAVVVVIVLWRAGIEGSVSR